MSDPFSAAASAVGIISLGLQVCSGIVTFYSQWKDYDDDIASTFELIIRLQALLETTESVLSPIPSGPTTDQAWGHIYAAEVSIHKLQARLEKIKVKLGKDDPSLIYKTFRKIDKSRRQLLYPFQQGTLGKLRDAALETRNHLATALQVLDVKLSHSAAEGIKELTVEIRDWRNEKENENILTWLSPLNFKDRHREIRSKHCPDTGNWFKESDQFQNWTVGAPETPRGLWCCGKMGSGKSVLMALAIDYLEGLCLQPDEAVVYLFCDWQDRHAQTATNLLGSIDRQLAESCSSIPEDVLKMYRSHNKGRTSMSLEEYLDLCRELIFDNYRRVYIVVDALDECNGDRVDSGSSKMSVIENALGKILREMHTEACSTWVLVSSRFQPSNPSINQKFQILPISATQDDLKWYIKTEILQENITSVWMNPRLQRELQKNQDLFQKLVNDCATQAGDMFLLAKFYITLIRSQLNSRQLRKSLDSLPANLEDSVDNALRRIQSQTSQLRDLGLKVILWLYTACRPLKFDELQHGLAVEEGDDEFYEDGITPVNIIVESCAGLVEIDSNGTIRLAHLFVKEYLEEKSPSWLGNPHYPLMSAAVTYLSFNVFTAGGEISKDQLEEIVDNYRFLSYAGEHWATHALCVPDDQALDQILQLLALKDRPQFLLRLMYSMHVDDLSYCPDNITAQHAAAFFGLQNIAKVLLKEEDANVADSLGRQPLFLAATRGHNSVIQRLLEHQANVSGREEVDEYITPSGSNWWAPTWARRESRAHAIEVAAEAGYRDIVSNLIKAGASLTDTGGLHGSPLEAAIFKGHKDIILDLLERQVPSSSMLQAAIYNGNIEILRLVLAGIEGNCTADTTNGTGRYTPADRLWMMGTAMYAACLLNRLASVEVLLEHKADATSLIRGFYRTPLQAAAGKGHCDIVRLFIETGANINNHAGEFISLQDKVAHAMLYNNLKDPPKLPTSFKSNGKIENEPPLDLAGYVVNEDDIKQYSEAIHQAKKLHPNPDSLRENWKPQMDSSLDFAASFWEDSHFIYVPSSFWGTRSGRHGSALQEAAFKGEEKMVDLLLEHGAEVNIYTGHFGTALQAAAAAGHLSIVQKLVTCGAHVNSLSGFHGNPLAAAASGGHQDIVEHLVEHGARVNARGGEYGYPLTAAARSGEIEVVRYLLAAGADPNASGGIFGHALQAAAIGIPNQTLGQKAREYGESKIEEGFLPTDLEDFFQISRDSFSVSNVSTLGVFGAMLQKAAGGAFGNVQEVFTNKRHGCGDEKLLELLDQAWESSDTSIDIIELLLKEGADVNACGGEHRTALSAAAYTGRLEIVEMLVKRGADTMVDEALAKALSMGHSNIVQYFLEQETVASKIHLESGDALRVAVKSCPDSTALLLEKGASATQIYSDSGDSPLHVAVRAGNVGAAQSLIDAGAQVDLVNNDRWSGGKPLEVIWDFNDPELVLLLLKNGASEGGMLRALNKLIMNLGPHGGYRNTPTGASIKMAIIRLLIDYGADINSGDDWDPHKTDGYFGPDVEAFKPLLILIYWAASTEVGFYQEILDSPQFDVQLQGTNALWCAVKQNNIVAVELLLKKGATVIPELLEDAISMLSSGKDFRGHTLFHGSEKKRMIFQEKQNNDQKVIVEMLQAACGK